MTVEFPGGLKAAVADLLRGGASNIKPLRRIALRNLVQRGVLLANFHWTDVAKGKQYVWLHGPHAEIGITQK